MSFSDIDVTTDTTDTNRRTGSYIDSERAAYTGQHMMSVRGDSSDDVDPRKLYHDPTIDELRWYYRNTFAKILVNKPIDDAYKTGFEIGRLADDDEKNEKKLKKLDYLLYGDTEDRSQRKNVVDYIDKKRLAEKKARRDGFALLFYGLVDTYDGPHVSPMLDEGEDPTDSSTGVEEITHFKVFTIDDLTQSDPKRFEDQLPSGYDSQDVKVREHGLVVATDPTDEYYDKPLGYIVDADNPQFIHRDRCQHFRWNNEVDGNYKADTLGEWEGNSILVSSYTLLKDLIKGNWAIMQALFRNAAQLYVATLPEDADEEDYNEAFEEIRNLNAKSELVLPYGYEVTSPDADGNMEPREHFDVMFDQICASNEMTKSVLFGTQAGTVSGSETDIKSYFNKVERYRNTRAVRYINEFVRDVNQFNWRSRKSNPVEGIKEIEIRWNPLFRISDRDRMEMFRTFINTGEMAVNGYLLTPDEVREIMNQEWSEWDIDIGNLTDSEKGMLEWVHDRADRDGEEKDEPNPMEQSMGGPAEEGEEGEESEESEEEEAMENPNEQNGGGMPEGHETASEQPNTASDGITIEPLV